MIRWERLSGLGVPVCVLAGLAFIVWGAWGINENAGRIGVGVAALVFAFLIDRSDKPDDIDAQAAALAAQQQAQRFGVRA
jgi:hypothetical protein